MRDQTREALAHAAVALFRGGTGQDANEAVPGRTITLTAAAPGEGVTTITAGLAHQLSLLFGLRVLTMSLSPGSPDLEHALARWGGTHELVGDVVATSTAPLRRAPRVALLREVPTLPTELDRLLRLARGAWDMALVDAPPCDGRIEPLLAARACGEAVLVIKSGNLPWEALRRARDELTRHDVAVVGTIMNFQQPALPRWLERITR